MNILGKTFRSVILCLALVITGQAYAGSITLQNESWGINAYATGNDADIIDTTFFHYEGLSYVELDSVTGEFTDYVALLSTQSGTDLSALYATGSMTGNLGSFVNLPGVGAIAPAIFNAGSINWYSNGTLILTMELDNGQGYITPDTDGFVEFQYVVSYVAAGYFFVDNGGSWVDLEDLYELQDYIMDVDGSLGIAGTEYIDYLELTYGTTENDINDVFSSIVGAPANFYYDDIQGDLGEGYQNLEYVTYSRGTAEVGIVPEPGMLSLMGLAFLGLAGFQRRRKSQQS